MNSFRVAFVLSCAPTLLFGAGNVDWSGRAPHPAVVDPVCGYAPGTVLDLGGEWTFAKNGYSADRSQFFRQHQNEPNWTDVRKIRVPGNWETQGVGEAVPRQERRTYDGYRHLPLTHYFNGDGWYRRTVKIPSDWKGKRVWLKVGGVGSQGWFWVNGQPVAHVFDYCATRKFEITDLVKPGDEAKFVAEVTNAGPSKHGYRDSCCIWGGITRALELEATPKVFIDDAWGRGDFDKRLAEVHVEIAGNSEQGIVNRLRVTIEGETAEAPVAAGGDNILRVPLKNFRPWSPESPNLYTAKVELVSQGVVVQERTERFGVRKLEVRGEDVYLNNRPFFWRGVGFHEIDPINGLHPADRAYYRDRIGRIRACGFNAVRLHTRCEWPEFFEVADELGLLIQPELPYYGDHPVAWAPFEPLVDAKELWENYRRHPSFAVYSGGNEGTFGPVLGKRFYDEIKKRDPDRLVLEQSTEGYAQWKGKGHVGTIDFLSQPVQPWPRGSIHPDIPLFAHEYMNLAVKIDTRLEKRYVGAWGAPMTHAQRDAWLARFGVSSKLGDRLQDAQHALQATWQKIGVESARKDPYCDGYYFWSMLDATCANEIGWTGKLDEENLTFMAQGVLNPFFEEKPNGQTMAGFARFNSPVGVFVDAAPEHLQAMSGERVTATVWVANYGEGPLTGAPVVWRVADGGGRTLAEGRATAGELPLGPVRKAAEIAFDAPSVAAPTAGRLCVSVGAFSNEWPCWLFPKRARRDGRDLAVLGRCRDAVCAAYDGVLPPEKVAEAKVVVADWGSPEAAAALTRGQSVIEVGGCEGPTRVALGWWFLNGIVGATFDMANPVLRHLPPSRDLSTLHFRIFKQGLRMPVPGFAEDDLAIVSEEGGGCYANLGESVDAHGGRRLFAYGLALQEKLPEATAILDGLVDRARAPVTAAERAKAGRKGVGDGGAHGMRALSGEGTMFDGTTGGAGRD